MCLSCKYQWGDFIICYVFSEILCLRGAPGNTSGVIQPVSPQLTSATIICAITINPILHNMPLQKKTSPAKAAGRLWKPVLRMCLRNSAVLCIFLR